jgi:hypothetical protein
MLLMEKGCSLTLMPSELQVATVPPSPEIDTPRTSLLLIKSM